MFGGHLNFRHKIRELFWKSGYDIRRLDPSTYTLARTKKLFEIYAVSVVLDVGANTGKFANYVRKDIGFRGELVSFEPLDSAFQLLHRNAAQDPHWRVLNVALGHKNGKASIHRSINSESSSLLPMLPRHLSAAPASRYVANEVVQVKTLDSLYKSLCTDEDSVFLKIDTQGYEKHVLDGARKSLAHIDTIQLEMSLVPLYRSETVFSEMYSFLTQLQYDLVSIEPVYFGSIPSPVLQVDGIFHRY